MSEPTMQCTLCGNTVTVLPDGRGFPPKIAENKLRKRCKAAGCRSEPVYTAGFYAGGGAGTSGSDGSGQMEWRGSRMSGAGKPTVFRVIREKVGGVTVRILLEPYRDGQMVQVGEGDEFVTGTLSSDPWTDPGRS